MAKVKRPRTAQVKNGPTFETPEQLIEALRSRNPDALRTSLVSFRNQITVGYDERPSSGDARVLLVTSWLDKSAGASELFDIWDTGSNYTSLVLASLAHILSLISGTPAASTHAPAILRVLFDSTHARRLNAHLASGQTDVVLAALRVLGVAATIDQRATFDAIAWTAKALPKLLSHRHRTPTSQPLAHPSIRTGLTTLILSLLPLTLPLDIFTALFRGLAQDDGAIVKLVLETCWEKVWGDVRVPKSLKVKVFGGLGLHIQPLYERTEADSTDPLVPADVAHHFLLALCTRPGTGLCFRSRGWYPRPTENPFEGQGDNQGKDGSKSILEETTASRQEGTLHDEESSEAAGKGTVYNPLLLKLLRTLRPAADARQHELAVRILGACPDLVGAYFGKGEFGERISSLEDGAAQIGLHLDPRLSTRWITSVGFVSAVVGADVPVDSFLVDRPKHDPSSSQTHRADPPPLSSILENIVPSVLTRAWLTKGLLARPAQAEPTSTSAGSLVQHTTLRLITMCLLKLSNVLAAFPANPIWSARGIEVVDAVRKRVPELSVIVGVAQEATKALKKDENAMATDGDEARGLLLAEGALRLLWLYARVLPGAMAETKFDVGKLLQETGEGGSEGNGLRVMCQIHMLRLLGESDQFVWSAKPTGSPHTHMYRLFDLHLQTPHAHLRAASATLIVRLLGTSLLFEHDPREAHAWIEALPRSDPTRHDFLIFLDDVLTRCIKTPYKYLEQGIQLYGPSNSPARMPSSLLMTVLEQLRHKPMEDSARRVVGAFVARLVRLLVGKMDVSSAKAILEYLRDIGGDKIGAGIVKRLETFLGEFEVAEETNMDTGVVGVVGTVATPSGALDRIRASSEHLGAAEVLALAKLMGDGIELEELLDEVDLGNRPDIVARLGENAESFTYTLNRVSFPIAFWVFSRHGTKSNFAREAFERAITRLPNELLVWACGLVAHRVDAATKMSSEDSVGNCISALLTVVQHAARIHEASELKQAMFGDLSIIQALLMDARWIHHFGQVIAVLLSSSDETDRALAAPYSQHWSGCLLDAKTDLEYECSVVGFTIWIPFVPGSTCVRVFGAALKRVQNWSSVPPAVQSLLGSLATYLYAATLDKSDSRYLAEMVPELLKAPALPEYRSLLKLGCAIVERELPLGLNLALIDPSERFSDIIQEAAERWSTGSGVFASIDWAGFTRWVDTEELSRLTTSLLYLSASARIEFSNWVGQQSALSSRSIGPCFAFMDCYSALANRPALPKSTLSRILDCAARLLFKNGESNERQRWAAHTLVRATHAFSKEADTVVQAIAKRFPTNPRDVFNKHTLWFFAQATTQPSIWDELVDSVVDSGLLWLVRRFAEDETDSSELLACLPIFGALLPQASNIKPHLAEPVLVATIKNRLQSKAVLSLCTSIVAHSSLKPMTVNKLLQSILYHPSFTIVCETPSHIKDRVIDILHSLFHKHPSSTCHPSHIIPLLQVYRGSLDRPDAQVLEIFYLFEKSRQMSVLEILKNWTPGSSHPQPRDLLRTVCNFDSAKMFRTCTSFPQRRDPRAIDSEIEECQPDIYDPDFVLPLLAALMVSDEPITSIQWVDLCRTNVLSLAIASLSSKQPNMRQLGYASLVTAYSRLPDVDFYERAQVIYTLDLLRNLIPQPAASPSHPIPRLATYTTLLLSHALRDIFAPSTPLYPLISRFLLQRPEFDPTDVPMLYTLLYSSSGEWKHERGWILRFLADGLRSTEDWKVLKKRHTWDLLASLFQSATGDRTLRLAVLEILANGSANKHAATSLLLGSSVLSWISMQLTTILPGEDLAYCKILDNISIVVDHRQIENATAGHWRDTIAEIIGQIVQDRELDLGFALLASQVLLRLTVTLSNTPLSFARPLRIILKKLHGNQVPRHSTYLESTHTHPSSIFSHSGKSLVEPTPGTQWEHWRSTVSALWRVTIDLGSNCLPALNILNCWALLVGSHEGTMPREFAWIREQVVSLLIHSPM